MNKQTNERVNQRIGAAAAAVEKKLYSYHFCGQIQVCTIRCLCVCERVEEFATTAIFYGCRISFWVCPANETTTTATAPKAMHNSSSNNNINHIVAEPNDGERCTNNRREKNGWPKMPCCFRHTQTD